VNQFVKCATLGWFYVKGTPYNSNKWVVIGIMPIVQVPLPPKNGAWECGYLIVEYFNQYLDKHGNKEHCPNVEVSLETCYHYILTAISKFFQHCILLPHGSTFGTKTKCVFLNFYVSMGIWFLCLHIFNRLHVSSLCFYVKAIFQKYDHVSRCGIRFCMKAMF
jgi:hypothetical protein